MRTNPNCPLPFDPYFAEDFAQLEVRLATGTTLYRARRGYEPGEYGERLVFRGNEIAAPPLERALSGRANAERHRVLYCADQEKTAIAEVRPPLGYYVSVGTLRLNREARILDLTMEYPKINPFVKESLGWWVEIESLLGGFAEEMSRPLERDDDKTHYLPCQILAKFIRDSGYDGIRYPSAVNPEGSNVVMFDPTIANVTDSSLAKITELTFEYEVEEAPGQTSQPQAAPKTPQLPPT